MRQTKTNTVFEAVFFNVGQGDCSMVIDYGGKTAAMIDCANAKPTIERLTDLSKNGIKLDMIVLTHCHEDHYAGFVRVLSSVDISALTYFILGLSYKRDTRAGKRSRSVIQGIRQTIAQHCKAKPTFLLPNGSIQLGNMSVNSIYPDENDILDIGFGDFYTTSVCNDIGTVVKISYKIDEKTYGILVGADSQAEAWGRILSNGFDPQANVFRFPHHGSDFSNDQVSVDDVLNAIQPEYVVISVGSINKYKHPSESAIRAISKCQYVKKILCTQATHLCSGNSSDTNVPCAGDISFCFSSTGIQVTPDDHDHACRIKCFCSPICK
ncbi:MAG: MBL fold metallo-hydrolase [Armatimonadota bacterium]